MKITYIKTTNNWRESADACRTTVGKKPGEGDPSPEWKRKILLAEHSPIRLLKVKWKWTELPYFVSTHIVRHKIGIEHFVRTQREDRTNIKRYKRRQTDYVEHECEANAQALINISRDRLCNQSAKETRKAWLLIIDRLRFIEPELAEICVKECVYRGFCPEIKGCGYTNKSEFAKERTKYESC